MTIDEFVQQMTDISQAVHERLTKESWEHRYREIPVPTLQALYEKHRNINFRTPSDPFELVAVTFGFVALDVITRMKERYFGVLRNPERWPETVEEYRMEAEQLERDFLAEMELAYGRSRQ